MRLLRQLELEFRITDIVSVVARVGDPGAAVSPESFRRVYSKHQDVDLEQKARELLRISGAGRIATEIRVEWNPRLKTCAGRADYRSRLISLNPLLIHHPAEIDRTFRHELAHILAQFRVGLRRILPHGIEWQQACQDLGIGDEKRCHTLPFPISERVQRYLYKCPNCQRGFPRVRRLRRAVACLTCCRAHNGGEFDARFRLRLVSIR
jgi:predicted SprT family Zn-dependent metalloprotease